MNIQFSASALGTKNLIQGGGQFARELAIFSPQPVVSPENYYTPGVGGPAVSTSDYYHQNGLYWLRPYDLLAMGAEGAAVASREGKRYVWICSADHATPDNVWVDSSHLKVGYSNDPGTHPDTLSNLLLTTNSFLASDAETYSIYHVPYLVYNEVEGEFWIYAEASAAQRQHTCCLFKTTDFLTTELFGPTHFNSAFGGWSSFQRVFPPDSLVTTTEWKSVGLAGPSAAVDPEPGTHSGFVGYARYTSTLGETWSAPSDPIDNWIGDVGYEFGPCDYFMYNGQLSALCREDARADDDGMYAAIVAVDSDLNILTSPAPVRVTGKHSGVYPGPGYLQEVSGYVEDGVLHFWTRRGFETSRSIYGTETDAPYLQGGGLWQSFVDRYAFVIDETDAAQAAPFGLRASCTSGVVSLSWDDAMPGTTCRVRRYTTSDTSGAGTSVGDVTGSATTNTPTPGARYWYKVTTLEGATERGSRVIDVYASNATEFVNKHINRVLADGADPASIDATFLTAADALLTTHDAHKHLLAWADPSFGVKHTANVIERVYCLGTTRLPRVGDYTPNTSDTTYSTTGINSTAPAWVNANATSFGHFGGGVKFNTIRRKVQATFMAMYQKSHTNAVTLLGSGEFGDTINLRHVSGTPGNVSFLLSAETPSAAITVTAPLTGSATVPHVIAGVFDGTNVLAYGDGTAGAPDAGYPDISDLTGKSALKGKTGNSTLHPVLVSGSPSSKYNFGSEAFQFSGNEAQFSCGALLAFEKGLNSTVISAFNTFYRTKAGL